MVEDIKGKMSTNNFTQSDNYSKRRTSSLEMDPLESADIYYGPKTDPSNRESKFGRLRTRSVISPKQQLFGMMGFDRTKELTSAHTLGGVSNDYFQPSLSHRGTDDKAISDGNYNNEYNGMYKNIDSFSFEDLKKLHQWNLSRSGVNTPVISDSDSDSGSGSEVESDVDEDNKEAHPVVSDIDFHAQPHALPSFSGKDLDSVTMRSHSTGSLVGESENSLNELEEKNTVKEPVAKNNTNDSELAQARVVSKDGAKEKQEPHQKSVRSTTVPFPAESTEPDSPFDLASLSFSPSPSLPTIRRRGSADISSSRLNSKRFFISDIDSTLNELLNNEDTDHDCQITIDDTGPKVLKLGTANSAGFKQYDIRGTYMLSNLLQELTIAKRFGRKQMILDEARLNENPVSRLKRLISTSFWKNLTRQVNEKTILDMAKDTKIESVPRIYIPHDETEQFYYYTNIAKKNKNYNLQVEYLPEKITPHFVKSINAKPGLLALAVKRKSEKYGDLEGFSYVVPGGRFNEQYGWDSYFETLGLLTCGIIDPCIGMCENFIFEINHYGKILNANRSYYLCRSQPPFLTDMVLKVFDYVRDKFDRLEMDLLRRATLAAIKEYNNVWCSPPRIDPVTGLSTFHPDGEGIPPETESSHFHSVLKPFCEKYKLSFAEFTKAYNDGEIDEPMLDEYFLHDRAVRESGHDTSYRLEGICANLATVDLNCLLFKYEKDIAYIIKTYFDDKLEDGDKFETSEKWSKLAERRKELIEEFMWNPQESLYFDYNIKTKRQSKYESITAFYVLWAGVCSQERAEILINNSLSKFEEFGGLVSGTEKSRGEIGVSKPSRQWDYPFAWAPHQILVWEGLKRYNRPDLAQRLSYRWLYLMTLAFVDFNGIVVEKYDATSEKQPHKVEAEYGNQGSGFKGVATEGFGWVNASYLLGLGNLDTLSQRALGMVTSPTDFFSKMNPAERIKYGFK